MVSLAQQIRFAVSRRHRSAIQWVALNAAMAIAYFAAGKLGLKLAFVHASATAVWPPTGIAMAAALAFGPRSGPGVFLGASLTNVTTAGSAATAFGIATGIRSRHCWAPDTPAAGGAQGTVVVEHLRCP